MTKKEAIKYLQQLYPNGGHCWLDEQRIEAIGMAIQALQEESVSKEEPTPKVFEDMFNAKSAAESLGISQEEHDKIVDECIYGKEPVSEDLEEASELYMLNQDTYNSHVEYQIKGAFKAGANWQKEQLMAKAVEGDITFDYYGDDDKIYGCIAHNSFCLEDFGLKDRDKVKMILIKEG